MAAARINLAIEHGVTYERLFTYKPGKVPADLTGCTAKAQIRAKADATEVLLELSTTNGRIILGTTDGAIKLLIPKAVTGAITWKKGVWDFILTFADESDKKLMAGEVVINTTVTRDA
jgi:hypothetical protein